MMQKNIVLRIVTDSKKINIKVKMDKKVKKFAIAKARYALIQKINNKESVKIECI